MNLALLFPDEEVRFAKWRLRGEHWLTAIAASVAKLDALDQSAAERDLIFAQLSSEERAEIEAMIY